MKELNKEIYISEEMIDTVVTELVDREELLCKVQGCVVDITFI